MNRTIGVDLAGTSYAFSPDAANAGTVTISGVALQLEQIKLITNATRNQIIYNWADASVGVFAFQQFSATECEITLAANTSTHDPADRLDIIVNVDSATDVSTGELIAAVEALRMAVASLTRTLNASIPDASGRQRINAETAVLSSGTLTNCSTVTNLSQIGTTDARTAVGDINKFAADSLRRNITTS